MFCTHCAAEVLSIAANFCYSCGKELNEKADEPKSEMSGDSSAVSANDLITEMFHRGYCMFILFIYSRRTATRCT